MRAARIHQHGGPEVFQVEDNVPVPILGPKDLLIRQTRTSANHRDVWIRKGLSDDTFQIALPAILGVDFSGEVVEVGKEVTQFAVGDRIVANLSSLAETATLAVVNGRSTAQTWISLMARTPSLPEYQKRKPCSWQTPLARTRRPALLIPT